MSILGYGLYLEKDIQQLKSQYQKAHTANEAWKKAFDELKARPIMKENEQHLKTIESQKKEIIILQQFKTESIKQVESIKDLHSKEESLIKELTKSKEESNALKMELDETKKKIEILMKLESWVCVGENENEIGYGAVNENGIRYNLILIKKQHLNELPIKTENGNDIYTDGSSYPCSLMDFIRKDKKDNPHAQTIEAIKPTPKDEDKADSEDTTNTTDEDNEQEDNEPTGLTPNQSKSYSFIERRPGLSLSQLANDMNMDVSNLAKNLKALEEKKYIRRDENDKFFIRTNTT